MKRFESSAFQTLHAVAQVVPLPRLVAYQRCTCGNCRECIDNAKWDYVFAKFEAKEPDVRGVFQSALKDL